MKIQALGGCCSRSTQNYLRAQAAVKVMGCSCEVIHVSDPKEIAALGCLATPGLAIENKVVLSGRLLTVEQMVELLKKHGCCSTTKNDCCQESNEKECQDCDCHEQGETPCDDCDCDKHKS